MIDRFKPMSIDRMKELETDQDSKLTPEEFKAGWHFCYDWDGMLVNRYDTEGEGKYCTCFKESDNGQQPNKQSLAGEE